MTVFTYELMVWAAIASLVVGYFLAVGLLVHVLFDDGDDEE